MSDRVVARTSLAAVVMMFGLADTALAKTDAAVVCGAVKLKVAGATASALLGCHAKAAQKGLVTDSDCLYDASAKLVAAFVKAEVVAKKANATCPTEGDAAEAQREVVTFVDGVAAALRPQPGASKCVAKKLGSVGKYAQKLLGTHAANRVKADPVKSADKLAKAEALLASIFAKVDDKGKDCQTSGDEPDMAAAASGLVVAEVCDDGNPCTNDAIAGLVCQNNPVTCSEHHACDFRSGTCELTDCCLMSVGGVLCVVEIPIAQIPTSQTFCQSTVAAHTNLSLLNVGDDCIGWRATGADDCF